MALDSKLTIVASAKLVTPQDLGSATGTVDKTVDVQLATGILAGQADKVFSDTRTLAASASEDLDLAGVLLDPLGVAITFAKIKAVLISAAAANTNNVVVGNSSTNTWSGLLSATGTVTLRPGATFCALAGKADLAAYAVTAGTGDLLKVANSGAGTTVSYDIVIIGTSA